MEIKEAQKKLAELEKSFTDMLIVFERETGLAVKGLYLYRTEYSPQRISSIGRVEIESTLEYDIDALTSDK